MGVVEFGGGDSVLDEGADINDRDVVGDTPLMEAVWIGVPELVEFQLKWEGKL